MGDQAYLISDFEKENLRWEAKKFSAGEVWGRSEYPYGFDSGVHDDRNIILAEHHASNWRAFRTWGVSGVNSMWHYTSYWRLKNTVEKKSKIFTTDWENIQKPGYSPDIVSRQRERFDMGYEMSDFEETIAAKAITENQGPYLVYIGGKPENFTDKAHNFPGGESFEKQLIIINNSRLPMNCECNWVLNLPKPVTGNNSIMINTGMQERIPLKFDLPADLPSGEYEIKADFLINNHISRSDTFRIHVMAQKIHSGITSGIALFDPKGETAKLLDKFGLPYRLTESGNDLSGAEILIIGKEALKADGPGPDLSSLNEGLKVIVFEQTADVMEQRFGFRVQEYGLRKVFGRIAGHPVLDGINKENLRDWKGEATILPPKLEDAPEYKWCGIPVTRAWRCGTRGNVASVLIEKPACGNFLPIADGGFSLQYSPLMEYREDKGMVLFCQLDVTGRTEADPVAELLARNIISYTDAWKPSLNRKAIYAGDPSGKAYLEKASIPVRDYQGGKPEPDEVLIAGSGSGPILSKNLKFINKWMKKGGRVLAVGLDQPEINILLPGIQMKKEEHIAAFFKPFEATSPFAGVSPADVHNRAPREYPLVVSGAAIAGNGILAESEYSGITLCQLVPWQLDYRREQHNIKQTFRRSAFLMNRLLGNLGVASSIDFLARFNSPVDRSKDEKRWLTGLYLDVPEEWDDPYRFFRW